MGAEDEVVAWAPVVVGGSIGGLQLESAVVVGNRGVPAAEALMREGAVVECSAVVRVHRDCLTVV